MTLPAVRCQAAPRRGMLLLLVLSILALFLLIGAVGVLVSLRARETARAFAAALASDTDVATTARTRLDEALLKLIRGPHNAGALNADVTESLLEDKYGAPQSCQVAAVSGSGGTIACTVSSGLDFSNPVTLAAVAGRVLTFVPAAGDPTGPTSYRIIRGVAPNTLLLANVKPRTPLPLPTRPCEAVINGREFVTEPWDAFDSANPFLTVPGVDVVVDGTCPSPPVVISGRLLSNAPVAISGTLVSTGSATVAPALYASAIVKVVRPAFGGTNSTCTVDNDGDGVPDGIWLENVLPPLPLPGGGQRTFSVSYLVLDLDGRINLNAHGSFVRTQLTQSQYPQSTSAVPIGMGYGPADVDAAPLVSSAAELAGGAVPPRWPLLLQGGNVPGTATESSTTQWRPSPRVEATQVGRYGFGPGTAQPGGSTITGTNPLNADYWLVSPTPNSPTDLKARLQVFTAGSPPTLTFARPSPTWALIDTDDVLGPGVAAHPYRMRLDEDAPRDTMRAGVGTASDAIFTVAEFERLLRPFDADASTLAPRLAALLDDRAERARMTLTTDSWDTPAVVGAASRVTSAVTGGNPLDVLSPETVAGLRFNINRPITTASGGPAPAARQLYFRHLYTLVVALTGTGNASAAAQWAANAVEFRDPDSIMSWYGYDSNPLDGVWTPDAEVWGRERPELVITEATANGNQATARLYRPWAARLVGANTLPTECIDSSLGVSGTTNTLNATRVTVGGSGSSAVWRVSISGTATGLDRLLTSATAVAVNTEAGQVTITGTAQPREIVLQRLADPTKALGAKLDTDTLTGTNAYVDVHRVTIPLAARDVSRWLHWPNRDFVSHGELLTVPSGDPAELPEACFAASKETSLARTIPDILDATIVPSRFAGANVSVANPATNLAGTGFENFPYGQFSRWREAGRVNVNTVLPNPGHPSAFAHLDDAVWNALLGAGGEPNPVIATGSYAPLRSHRDLLVSSSGDARFRRTNAADSGFLARAPTIRLANVATTRSHVFAVWITLKISEVPAGASPPQYARMFAIVDRSIPVGYQQGRTLNAGETILLKRFIP